MWPDRVSNPGPLTSGSLPTALRSLAKPNGKHREWQVNITLFF